MNLTKAANNCLRRLTALPLVIATICATICGLTACSGKYLVRTYPSGAKVYTRDLASNEKKLIGISPVQLPEDSKLGDVFFLVFEKQSYKPKEVLVRVNEGESLTVSSRLDPASPGDSATDGGDKKDDKPPGGKPEEKPKKDELQAIVEDLKLRVALLENTVSFYKDAMFSERYKGNGQAKFDRDRGDKVVENLFKAQQLIVNGKYDDALKLIDGALEQDEYLSNAWLLKGSLKFLQKDYKGARLAWERCLKMDPYNKVAYTYLNKVYEKLGLGSLPPTPAAMRYPAAQIEIEKQSKR